MTTRKVQDCYVTHLTVSRWQKPITRPSFLINLKCQQPLESDARSCSSRTLRHLYTSLFLLLMDVKFDVSLWAGIVVACLFMREHCDFRLNPQLPTLFILNLLAAWRFVEICCEISVRFFSYSSKSNVEYYTYMVYTRSRRASSDIEWKQSSVLIWCKLISSSSLYLFYFDFSSCCHTLSISSIFERASIALQLSEKNSVWFISWRVNNCVYPSLTQCSLGLLSNHYVLFQVLVHMNEQMELKKKKSGDLKYRKW